MILEIRRKKEIRIDSRASIGAALKTGAKIGGGEPPAPAITSKIV
jgi:hypothetical protein